MQLKAIHPYVLQALNKHEYTLGQQVEISAQSFNIADSEDLWLVDGEQNVIADISIQPSLSVNIKRARIDYIYSDSEVPCVSLMLQRRFLCRSHPYIYLLSFASEIAKARQNGVLIRDSIQEEGFIHASPYFQLNRIANKYYREVVQPCIVKVDPQKVNAKIKWEPAKGGLYPHIYGELNMNAVVEISSINLNADGFFSF